MGWLKQLETRGRRDDDEMMTNTQLYKNKGENEIIYSLYIYLTQ